ncbi:MAG: hypothetical protein CMJ18_01020 [Phycisphaeraceae bacterium]|nr:hypothetical protein [Phycisphaeraceae bacterium]
MHRLLFVLVVPALIAGAAWWWLQKDGGRSAGPGPGLDLVGPRLPESPTEERKEDPRGPARLRLHLVDDGGRPLAARSLRVGVTAGPDTEPGGMDDAPVVTTDDRGDVEIDYPGTADSWVVVWEEERPANRGVRSLPRSPGPGRVAVVGPVVVSSLPLIAAGQVVASDGWPLSNANLQLVTAPRSAPGEWRYATRRFRSDRNGNFELRGAVLNRIAGIAVSRPGFYLPEIVTPRIGARDLRLVMRLAGRLKGNVVVPDGIDARALVVAVTGLAPPVPASPNPGRSTRRGRARLAARGQFFVHGLPPGLATVEIRLRANGTVVKRIPAVRIKEDEAVSDLRLHDVQVAHRLVSYEVTVVDALGEPIADAAVVPDHGRTPRRDEIVRTDASGVARVMGVRGSTFPALVVHSECCGRRVRLEELETRVALAAPLVRRVRVAGAGPLPAGYSVTAFLEGMEPGATISWSGGRNQRVTLGETMDVTAPLAGHYRLNLLLWGPGGGTPMTLEPRTEIRFSESTFKEVLAVNVSRNEITRAVEALK